jgi:hypothetical protein
MPAEPAVATCVTGLLRSALHPAVSASYATHVVAPVERAGYRVDTHMHVVGSWEHANTTLLRASLAAAYGGGGGIRLVLERVDANRYRCPPDRFKGGTYVHGVSDVLVQFLTIRRCYEHVEESERACGKLYAHLLRLRTDVLYLSDLPAHVFAESGRVWVPSSGMAPGGEARFRCMNDHAFVCPRALCRPYFHLLELFESALCRSAPAHSARTTVTAHTTKSTSQRTPLPMPLLSTAAEAPPTADADGLDDGQVLTRALHRVESPPMAPYQLPPLPLNFSYAQFYFFARYANAGRPCRDGIASRVPMRTEA